MVDLILTPEQVSARLRVGFEDLNARQIDVVEQGVKAVTLAVRAFWFDLLDEIGRGERRTRSTNRAAFLRILDVGTKDVQKAVETALITIGERAYDDAFDVWEAELPALYWPRGSELAEGFVSFAFDKDAKDWHSIDAKGVLRKGRATGEAPRPKPARKLPTRLRAAPKLVKQIKRTPPKGDVAKVIRSGNWKRRFSKWSKKITDPEKLADKLAAGIARGDDPNKLARSIQGQVGGFASSARRIVRTESQRIHNVNLLRTFDNFAEIIDGFEIVAVHDNRTRPTHAARDGTIYYKEGKPNIDVMPDLPDAPNCRCTYCPVVHGPRPAGFPRVRKGTYADWFAKQSNEQKAGIVGRNRWEAMRDKVGKPALADFMDPQTGEYISADEIESTAPSKILRKRERLNKIFAKRKIKK